LGTYWENSINWTLLHGISMNFPPPFDM
jgi:hypothetical protein